MTISSPRPLAFTEISARASARPAQGRGDLAAFDTCEIGRDAYPPSDHSKAGAGSIVVASIWLAFYGIAAVHSLASGNSNRDATATGPSMMTVATQSPR
jgi:hypothetical protein